MPTQHFLGRLVLALFFFAAPAFAHTPLLEHPFNVPKDCSDLLTPPAQPALAAIIDTAYAKSLRLIKAESERPVLSIVIPAYKEARRIEGTIAQIKKFFDRYPFPIEILIRIEKSPDDTATLAQNAV